MNKDYFSEIAVPDSIEVGEDSSYEGVIVYPIFRAYPDKKFDVMFAHSALLSAYSLQRNSNILDVGMPIRFYVEEDCVDACIHADIPEAAIVSFQRPAFRETAIKSHRILKFNWLADGAFDQYKQIIHMDTDMLLCTTVHKFNILSLFRYPDLMCVRHFFIADYRNVGYYFNGVIDDENTKANIETRYQRLRETVNPVLARMGYPNRMMPGRPDKLLANIANMVRFPTRTKVLNLDRLRHFYHCLQPVVPEDELFLWLFYNATDYPTIQFSNFPDVQEIGWNPALVEKASRSGAPYFFHYAGECDPKLVETVVSDAGLKKL